MCDFITVTLERKTDLSKLRPVFERHGFSIGVVIGPELDGEISFRPTLRMCDCGTVIGNARARGDVAPKRSAASPAALRASERRAAQGARFRAHGWTTTKIERWQRQLEENDAKPTARKAAEAAEASRWLALLADALADRHIKFFGLMVHSYGGAVENVGLPRERKRVLLKETTADLLREMEDGVLYRFVSGER